MKALNRTLSAYFSPGLSKPRRAIQRTARDKARRLAGTLHVELEVSRSSSGINVWPTRPVDADPYDGDHYAEDWHDVLERLGRYAEIPILVR